MAMSEELENTPWFCQDDVDQIVKAFNKSHAVLLNGAQGIGKSYLVSAVARQLFTRSASSASSHLFNAGTHPDIHVLTSAYAHQYLDPYLRKFCFRYLDHEAVEKKRLSRQIGVDTIRMLVESMNESSSSGGYKLAVIYPAEHLNINSANAILKFLEEPTANTFLILVSHDISRLTATTRSRCMRINVALPDAHACVKWLNACHPQASENEINCALTLAGCRPLLAADYLSANQQSLVADLEKDLVELCVNHTGSSISISKKWVQHKQTDFILGWIVSLFTRLIKVKLDSENQASDSITGRNLLQISNSFSSENLFNIYDYLKSVKHSYDGIVDETLLIEDVLQTVANHRSRC